MKTNQLPLPFTTIMLAVDGDVTSVNEILNHFEPYIIKLPQKTLFDEYGNPHIHIEPTIKRNLETKLIVAILKFEFK